MDNPAITELNALLKGEEMAIHAYDRFINDVEDIDAKNQLKKFQSDHKKHSEILAKRIADLGGQPQHGTGTAGMMASVKGMMEELKGRSTAEILKDAYDGEDKGIAAAEEVVKGDLDSESSRIVNQILTEDHAHLREMAKLINKYEES
ncbi:rubrerythrin family protein [Clostridium thermosuccinogenes]|jgi:bacterioferritin (cytochrome b1)|uniref:Rubrerythrin family protein n=1 Tax=Clostridium thermosuccinogenes TaxID=84032 RepID=A0A2K2FQH7_9CLOT|nr:DUF2383 domain-containing protein [Pseudoclostridium thermosuccinogenes]AUS95956.1 rubrerythrin family protein [Pseudoclostridium thermosuccinogenes]PNT99345.1 rubrerythrin family protein [Pseudoclostridium thermosuccinogenes]PNU01032.1 rubrerythrin family protein [Pseudoclostridium thermosuccinogenes]